MPPTSCIRLKRAIEFTEESHYGSLDTLACALFVSGRIVDAFERASQAFEPAKRSSTPSEHLAEIQANLERFEAALGSGE
jgi:hypothetical protein